MPDEERKYTLAEADALLRRRRCMEEGHDLEQEIIQGDGVAIAVYVFCERCHASFKEVES